MSALSIYLDGTRLGRSTLALATQHYLKEIESDVVRLESQLWKLIRSSPAQKPRYVEQWRETVARLESEASQRTGLTVEIHTPEWLLLWLLLAGEKEKAKTVQTPAQTTERTNL